MVGNYKKLQFDLLLPNPRGFLLLCMFYRHYNLNCIRESTGTEENGWNLGNDSKLIDSLILRFALCAFRLTQVIVQWF